jgi:DNA-binding CsgD family transcriptional regulator
MSLTLANRDVSFDEPRFLATDSEDVLWKKLAVFVRGAYGVTSMLYAFTHSKFTVTRTGFMPCVYMRHDHPEDFVASYGQNIALDDTVSAHLILEGRSHLLWSDFHTLKISPTQRAQIAREQALGMGTGITFGFRFGANSGYAGLGWASRDRDPEEFRMLVRARGAEMERVGAAFDKAMRPAMIANRIHLTRRERDVLSLSAGGMTAKQIAAHLNISLKTVGNTLERAREAIGAVSTMEAVVKALVYELIQ